MKMKIIKKIAFASILMTILFMGICEAAFQDISGEIIRLHVVADSNSKADQQVKLLVRDRIIEEAEKIGEPFNIDFAKKHKFRIQKIANEVLLDNGFNYLCRVETGKFYFPTKVYENITLPAGEYEAVRVILGKGKGENWWCVMYPPLCFTDSAKGELTKENEEKLRKMMGEKEYKMISGEDVKMIPAFRAIEILHNFKEKAKEILRNL